VETYIHIALVFLCAAFVQGFSGFGSALVAMPLLLLFLNAKTAVPLCILNGLIITFFLSMRLKRHFNKKKILPLLAGCLPGIIIGTYFLKNANDIVIQSILGVILIVYSLFALILKPKPRHIRSAWAYAAGFATGVIGEAFSTGGPPAIIYTTLSNWTKDEIKATLTALFFTTGIIIAIAHAVSGITTIEVLRFFLASILPVVAGVAAGSALYGKVTKDSYIKALLVLLLILGVMLVLGPGGR